MRTSRWALGGVFLVTSVASLDHNIVATALPDMVASLSGLEHIAWVVTAFSLSATVTMPLYGKLGDLFGRRTMLLIAVSVFLLASMLCGLAQSMLQLILFRGLQGLGAGGLFTLASAVMADIVAPAQRPRVQATLMTAIAACQFAGPVVGGLLTEFLSWRWVFLINLPVGIAALALIWLAVPHKVAPKDVSIDYLGALTLTIAASLFMLALSALGLPETRANSPILFLGAALAAVAVFFVERRAREPILPFSVFKTPLYVVGVTALGFATFAASGAVSFTPLFLQTALGLTPSQSGMAIIAQVLGMLCTNTFITRSSAVTAHLKTVMLIGVSCETLALTGLAVTALTGGGLTLFLVFLFLRGVGMGANTPLLMTLVQSTANSANMGVATSTMMFTRALGGVLGATIAGLVINMAAQGADPNLNPSAFGHAIGVSFAFNAAVMCAAIFFVTRLPAPTIPTPPAQHRPRDPASPIDPPP